MSEKRKREVSSTENSDEKRFRDILKESEDILKTAYPSEEDEDETKKEPINPFVEKAPPRNKLSADFSPDGKVLMEDNPERKKELKAWSREEEKNKIRQARQKLKREKLLMKIKELEPKLALIKEEKDASEGSVKFEKYRKTELRLTNKINDLQQRAVSAEQFTPNSGFYIKAHILKIWVVVLVILVSIVLALSTLLITATYRDLAHYRVDSKTQRESVSKLNNELQTVNKEKDSAAGEVESLTQKVSSLEKELQNKKKENDALKPKAEFLDDHILIVNGSIFKKTYHKYGCDKIDYSSFKAYNKEQVQGKFGFTPCSHCIK